MSAIATQQSSPFITGTFEGQPIGAVSAEDRIALLRKFSVTQLEAALATEGLQKTVKAAIERRLRALKGETR